MSASDFTILKQGNISTAIAYGDEDDDDDDDEDLKEAKENGANNRLKNASMSESYSEILDSPIKSPTTEIGEAIRGSPMRIPSRRPNSLLQQTASKCIPYI